VKENEMIDKIEAFLLRLERQNKAPKTIRLYRLALTRYSDFIKAGDLPERMETIEAWIKDLECMSVASQRCYFAAVRAFYHFYKKNICDGIEYSFRQAGLNKNRAFDRDQIRQVISFFEDRTRIHQSYSHFRDEVILKLVAITGARISEIINLTIDDIKTDENGISLVFRNTKTRQDRTFPMITRTNDDNMRLIATSNRVIENLLKAYKLERQAFIQRRGIKTDNMFISNLGKTLSYIQFRKVFDECMVSLKLGGTIHWLRHSFATQKIEEGAPMGGVAFLLGHSSPTTTLRIYTHYTEKMLSRITYNNIVKERQ
jgi:site-specific recombinase XerD